MFSSIALAALLLQVAAGAASAPAQGSANAPAPQAATPKQPPASITGQIVSLTGAPINNAEVTARRTDGRGPGPAGGAPSSGTTDGSGVFTIADLQPGTYVLSVRKGGYVEQQYGASRAGSGGTMLRVGPGQELRAITIKLIPHGVISGKVIDENAEPMMYTQVQAMQQRFVRGRRQWMPVGSGQVNDLGEYRIPGLQPGRYLVAVAAQPRGPRARTAAAADESYVTTYYPGAYETAQAAAVDVTSGAETRGIDFRMRKTRTYRISGKVADAGRTRPNMMVMLLPAQESFGFAGRNYTPVRGPDGAFEIGGVLPGSYSLVAQRMGGPNERGTARQEVTVGNANVEGVVLTISPGFEVTGTLRVEGKAKLAVDNLRVMLEPQTSVAFPMGSSPGAVKSDGAFRIENVTGERYRVNVFPLTEAYVKTVRLGNQEMKDGVVDLTAGAAGPLEVVLSTDGAVVEGTVQDSKTRPTAGVVVALIPDPPNRDKYHLYRQATTDTAGAFSFKAVAPGGYKIFAWEDIEESAWMDPNILARYENEGKSLALKESGQERLTLRFIAPEGGSRLEREADEREKSTEPKP